MFHAAPVNSIDDQNMELNDLTRLTRLLEDSRPRWLAIIARRSSPELAKRRGAEDIYQQACEKACTRWTDFVASGMSEKSWLYRIVLDCLGDDRDYHFRMKRNVHAETQRACRNGLVG